MGIAEVLLRYVLEVIKLSLGNEIFCGKKQRYEIFLFGIGANLTMWLLLQGIEYRFVLRLVSGGIVLGFMYASVVGAAREKADVLLRTWLASVICDGGVGVFQGIGGKERMITGSQTFYDDVIKSLWVILILCLIFILKETLREKQKKWLAQIFYTYAAAVIAGVVFVVLVLLGILTLVSESTNDIYWKGIMGVIREGGTVGAGLLGLLFLSVKSANDRLSVIRWQQEKHLMRQREYYEVLLKKEEDTRKYRHDMQRNLRNLYALQKDGKGEQANLYLKDMMGELEEIQKRVYVTGNDVLDILSNVYLAKLGDGVEITFHHQLLSPVWISDMDLCTICGNLLENAVEEICRAKNVDRRFLRMEINCGQFWFSFSLDNSITKYSAASKAAGGSGTKKNDVRNHGLGLKNVKAAVERLGGSYEARMTDKAYSVTVTLPNKEKVRE